MDYQERVEGQIKQFANKEALVGLPKIYRYWNQNYVIPKIESVFGVRSLYDIYADNFIAACRNNSGKGKILSIGCGDGVVEIMIAQKMIEKGFTDFIIIATELSEIRIERARKLAKDKEVDAFFEFKVVDVNTWSHNEKFSGVMAQHTLHHIVELERLFNFINENLDDKGVFVVVDMIGRNGHMRWPETLKIVEQFWNILPEQYKFNHQFKKYHENYINWDCSVSGFEGIRAQDILPLLIESFDFSHFLGVGGFVDVFVERGYGHNFNPESSVDCAWIDIIAKMNDSMLIANQIKPTLIFAICQKKTKIGKTELHSLEYQDPTSSVRKN